MKWDTKAFLIQITSHGSVPIHLNTVADVAVINLICKRLDR